MPLYRPTACDIRDRKEPATTTEVRAFTNAAGYFRHLIEKFDRPHRGPENPTVEATPCSQGCLAEDP
jgi:hypothetical protein